MKKNNRVVLGALWWCWFFFRDRDDNYTWYGDQQTHRTHQRLILSLVWRRLSVHSKLPSHQFHVLFSFPMYFIYSLTIKKNLQYSTVFFYWTFSRFVTFPCVRRWPPNSAAPAYPMKMFSFFLAIAIDRLLLYGIHCICIDMEWNRSWWWRRPDCLACHVFCLVYLCDSDLKYLKTKTSFVLNCLLFRFGPSTFDRLHGQHVGAGITHGGGPPFAFAPRFYGTTFLFGW